MSAPRRAVLFVPAGLLLALLAAPRPAAAQAGSEAIDATLANVSELEFNFSNPGARSLAMGGAFLGRADDASAAYANPAGLVELTQPEISVEVRDWTYTAKIGLPTLESGGISPAGEADLETQGVLFASVVYPRDRWTLAAYRFEVAGYDFGSVEEGSLASEAVTFGLAGAYRFDNGLSVGLVLVHNEVSIEVAAPCPTRDACAGLSRTDDTTIVGNLGILWHFNDRWSAGAVYRKGPEFALGVSEELLGATGGQASQQRKFAIPDVVGVGLGLRPNSRLVLNFDLVKVRYAQVPETVGLQTIPKPDGEPFGSVSIDDADELHFGLEYSFWNARGAPAIRFGAWWDPAHKTRFLPAAGLATEPDPALGVSEAQVAAAFAQRFDGGKDRLHVSAGFGYVIGRRFQLDAGVDVSDETQSVSVSTLVRF